MHALLILIKRGTVAQKFTLQEFPIILGRGDTAHVQLDDCWASRTHCEISLVRGTLVVRDLDSRHGTLVNGCSVASAPLMPGDHLIVGVSLLRVTYQRYTLDPAPPTVYAPLPADSISCGQPDYHA